MKIREIREMNTEELKKRIDEEERIIVDLRFSHQLKQLTNTAKLGLAKKDIARLKTVLREREMAETSSKTNEGVKA